MSTQASPITKPAKHWSVSALANANEPLEMMRRCMSALLRAVPPALCLLVSACVLSVPSAPGAENIILTHNEADVASCKPLGNVIGVAETDYVRDERREMQNQTVELGGDTILLTKEKDPPKGTAYRCTPPVGTTPASD